MGQHIHIGGTTRSGKSTLAENLRMMFLEAGHRAAVIDVDSTRTATFGEDEPILGTLDREKDAEKFNLQKKMQGWSYNNVFTVQIPLVLQAGATPIFAATHASLFAYKRSVETAVKHGNQLRFLLLEDPTFEEMARRCREDSQSKSDMRDPMNNETERRNWEDITARIHQTYDNFTEPLCRIPQGSPQEMLERAWKYLREGK